MPQFRTHICYAASSYVLTFLLLCTLPSFSAGFTLNKPSFAPVSPASCRLPSLGLGSRYRLLSRTRMYSSPEDLPPKPSEGEIDWDNEWKKVASGEIKVREVAR